MKVKVDFQLSRQFGVVERLIFKFVLNGFCSAREIRLALPIFSDAVIANAVRHLVNEQIITVDIETGTISLSEAMVAIIAMSQQKSLEVNIPVDLEKVMHEERGVVFDDNKPETIMLKDALIQELLPNVKLDSYRNSLNFIILPDGGISNE